MKIDLKWAAICGAVFVAAASPALAGPVFGSTSYNNTLTLQTLQNYSTPTGAAFDGTNFYAVTGAYPGSPIVEYDAAGVQVASTSPTPGIDFRAVSTDLAGDVFAKGYNSPNTIYKQGALGQFTAFATLQGAVDNQQQVVVNADGTGFVGHLGNSLNFWDNSGVSTGSVTIGLTFGDQSDESVSVFGSNALVYEGGTLYAFSLASGALLDQTILVGANTSYNGQYGQGYARNGYFFVGNDNATFNGYQIGTPSDGEAVPEPASWALMIGGFGLAGAALRRRRLAIAA